MENQLMTFDEIGNRIEALDGEKSSAGDLKVILNQLKGHHSKTSEEVQAKLKLFGELEEKVQKLMEDFTAAKQIMKPAVDPVQKDNIIAGKALGSMYRYHSKGNYADLARFISLGGKRAVREDEHDWKDDGWNIMIQRDQKNIDLKDASEEEVKAALGTVLRGDAVTGSYLVPQAFDNEVWRIADQASQMMGKVTSMPMGVRKITFNRAVTGVQFYWPTNETTAKSEVNPTFTYFDLEAKTAAAWLTITEELNEDSEVSLAEYFMKVFGEAWGQEFDKQVLNSNSAPFVGWLYNTSVVQQTMGAGQVGFEDLTFDDLYDMQTAIPSGSRFGAKYIMNSEIFTVAQKIKDANGNYIYQQPAGDVPATICGRPFILADAMPGLSDSAISTNFLAYGNPANCLHGNRVGFEFRIFDQTAQTMQYDQIFFRVRLRQAFVIALPAALCKLRTAAA